MSTLHELETNAIFMFNHVDHSEHFNFYVWYVIRPNYMKHSDLVEWVGHEVHNLISLDVLFGILVTYYTTPFPKMAARTDIGPTPHNYIIFSTTNYLEAYLHS